MSQQFTPAQRSTLRQRFRPREDLVPIPFLDATTFANSTLETSLDARYFRLVNIGIFATASQGLLADTALQPGEAATPSQGSLADTALQPGQAVPPSRLITTGTGLEGGGSLTTDLNISLNSASIASLALADTALQSAPVLKVYQATASGATPETFTLPETPSAGSSVIVFVEAVPHHLTATDPPASGNFYWSGTTVKVDTIASDRVSIYYVA